MNEYVRPIGEDDLQAWVDGRLDAKRLAEVDAWLERNPVESARYGAYRSQREQLRTWLLPKGDEVVPLRLRADVLLARRRASWRQRWAAAAAGVLLLAGGGAGGWLARGGPVVSLASTAPATMLSADAVRAHLTFVSEVRHPVEVPASQEVHLVGWLSQRLGRTVRIPELASLGFRLMGGRLLPGDSSPAAQFMYDDDHGTRLTLYMRAEPGAETGFEVVERAGITGFRWSDGGFGYAVLAETDRARLLDVAQAVFHQIALPPSATPTPRSAPAAPL